MPPILIFGSFLPKLHSIKASFPEAFATQTYCVALACLETHIIIPLIKKRDAQIIIVDLSSYSQDVHQLLTKLWQKELSQLEIVIIHHYEGAILDSMQSRFPHLHFRSLQEVNTQLLSLLLVISDNCSLHPR